MKIRELLKKIQNSDENIKKRWLIGASAISILLIIIIWLIYLKFTTNSNVSKINPEKTIGFWQIFKNGLIVIFQSIKDFFINLFLELTKEKTIIIK
ncbi:hypothetical protein JW698_01230 [Candidatus Wolfebacteria bacterium]|nr:hypothetical protein [Candidatus Wolfebacteria bacterium]